MSIFEGACRSSVSRPSRAARWPCRPPGDEQPGQAIGADAVPAMPPDFGHLARLIPNDAALPPPMPRRGVPTPRRGPSRVGRDGRRSSQRVAARTRNRHGAGDGRDRPLNGRTGSFWAGAWLRLARLAAVFDRFKIAKNGHCTACTALDRFGGGLGVVCAARVAGWRCDHPPGRPGERQFSTVTGMNRRPHCLAS